MEGRKKETEKKRKLTSVGIVVIILLRARLGLLEVLVFDFNELHHFSCCGFACVCVFLCGCGWRRDGD